MHEYFWQPIGKPKGKHHWKLCILQKLPLYLNQFSNKKGVIGKPERPKKHPIWSAQPRTATFPLCTPPSPEAQNPNKAVETIYFFIKHGCFSIQQILSIKINYI